MSGLICGDMSSSHDIYTCMYQGPVSGKILSIETDLSSLITLVTIVFSKLKIARALKIF